MVTNLLDFRLFRNVKTYEKYTCVLVELFGKTCLSDIETLVFIQW